VAILVVLTNSPSGTVINGEVVVGFDRARFEKLLGE